MNALALSEADLVELRLLRDRLRQESERVLVEDVSGDCGRALATDATRQSERWLAVIERILKDV